MIKQYYTISELYSLDKKTYLDIENTIKSENFPCLFAINSLHKNHLHVYDARESLNLPEDIYKQLSLFSNALKPLKEKNFYTMLVLVPDITVTSENIQKFIFNLLIRLKKYDSTSLNIDEILTKDFEFTLDTVTWFPVFLCPGHISKIRTSKISIIAFQPKKTFEVLKMCPHNFYEKTRKATHRRIDLFYKNERPFFLSNQSSGINAIQYIGFDPKNPNK